VPAVASGDVVNNQSRGRFQLAARDFLREGKLLRPAIEAAGVQPFINVLDAESSLGFVANFAARGAAKTNWAAFVGESRDTCGEDIERILTNSADTRITLGVGGDEDHIAQRCNFAAPVEDARLRFGIDSVHMVEVTDGSHSWGDNILLHSAFLAYAIARTQAA